jgi:YidC/Oxa1 family membrane protein insertase
MPQPKNSFLRFFVPAVAITIGLFVVWAFIKTSNPVTTTESTTKKESTSTPAPTPAPAQSASAPTAAPTPVAQPATMSLGALQARVVDSAQRIPGTTIGSLDPKSKTYQQLTISDNGAGIADLKLSGHFTSIKEDAHVALQSDFRFTTEQGTVQMTPFGIVAVEFVSSDPASSQRVPLVSRQNGESVWRRVEGKENAFEAIIETAAEKSPVLRIERVFTLNPESYEIEISQKVFNLSSADLTIRLTQMGPLDLPQDSTSYGGDKRRMRVGYVLSPEFDPTESIVQTDRFDLPRADVLDLNAGSGDKTLWPNDESREAKMTLAWVGFTNRYYAAAVYPLINPADSKPPKKFASIEKVTRVFAGSAITPEIGMRLHFAPVNIRAGGEADLSLAVFAGPMDKRVLKTDPRPAAMNLKGLPYYNFGGPCAFCTFDSMTSLLLWLVTSLHSLTGDWAIAIFLLVVIVRTILHPLTKSTQIKMARFGKQMASMAPKQKQIQEKFKDDPKRLQEEMGKLWREEGVSPLGMLGCLPTFLQTPVWIALSATLYFAVELRHQGAFYGIMQLQPANSPFWNFLGDLAEPDRFYYFGKTIANVPLLGPIESVNVLPLVLGVVFYLQQKYLKPPQTTEMTPEQEFQQKMMQWMMVIMFPLMMYNAPSGLSLYFLANSVLGIFEARYIRAHMEKYDLLNVKKPVGKSGGFMQRLQELAEQKRKEAEAKARQQSRKR